MAIKKTYCVQHTPTKSGRLLILKFVGPEELGSRKPTSWDALHQNISACYLMQSEWFMKESGVLLSRNGDMGNWKDRLRQFPKLGLMNIVPSSNGFGGIVFSDSDQGVRRPSKTDTGFGPRTSEPKHTSGTRHLLCVIYPYRKQSPL